MMENMPVLCTHIPKVAMQQSQQEIMSFIKVFEDRREDGKYARVVHDDHGLCKVFCGEPIEDSISNQQQFGDSVAWGGCTITYLLSQQLHFELFDFVYQMLNVAESESVPISYPTILERSKQAHYGQDLETFLENAKKARRLNNHVFSMLKARSPLEDKMACAIKQSGAPVPRIKYSNTLSAFETLPQK
ncbi:hypothetical protein KI387_006594, partial [Taxus chinensis]